MPDQATAAKIKSHKFGRRRLTSVAALALLNKQLKAAPEDSQFVIMLLADAKLQTIIDSMNDALDAAAVAAGFPAFSTDGAFLKFPEANYRLIPKSVWLGYIDIPTGAMSTADREAFQRSEAAFADAAGKFRARIAMIQHFTAVRNDMGNIPEHPNPGGVVGRTAGGPPHD